MRCPRFIHAAFMQCSCDPYSPGEVRDTYRERDRLRAFHDDIVELAQAGGPISTSAVIAADLRAGTFVGKSPAQPGTKEESDGT